VFGLGLQELFLVAVVLIIFVNPKDLPALFRKLGNLVRQMKELRESYLRGLQEAERDESPPRSGGDQPDRSDPASNQEGNNAR
jgi:Sec-independent protein translocase protein TatA